MVVNVWVTAPDAKAAGGGQEPHQGQRKRGENPSCLEGNNVPGGAASAHQIVSLRPLGCPLAQPKVTAL